MHSELTHQATWVGKSVRRVEDHRLLTGAGQYVDDGATLVHPEFDTNIGFEIAFGSSEEDVVRAFGEADHVVQLRIESPRINPLTMEPRAIAVEYLAEQDRFLVRPSHQTTFGAPRN